MATAKSRFSQPAQIVTLGFLFVIITGTVLLSLSISRSDGTYGGALQALFTAVSAVCVTGLSTVDVANYWTPFGHLVILGLIKIGGFGIMTFTTLLGVFVSNRMSLKNRITASTESKSLGGGDVRRLLAQVFAVSAIVEISVSAILALRLHFAYGYQLLDSIWYGLFHGVSAFNNAGFALYSDSLISFASDPVIQLSICVAIIIGGLGFPVLFELGRKAAGRTEQRRIGEVIESKLHWTLTSRIVLWATLILIFGGALYIGALEWNNPNSIGTMSVGDKLLNVFTQSVYPRTAGFNSIDLAQLQPATLFGIDVLMFIGGGSGGTAGGIKVTTAAVLVFIVLTEIKGDTAVNIGKRRLPRSIQRQALTIMSLASGAVIAAIIAISLLTKGFTTDQIIFEVISAFATVGLTTGITPSLPPAAQFIIIGLMFIGRIGPAVVATALASRTKNSHFEHPRERPTIG